MRRTITAGTAIALAGVLATVVLAGTVNGTPKNDSLRGTAKADTINGKAGNDKLFGLGGNDHLIGGPGNDVLVGGPGADDLNCGPGKDAATADDSDKVSPSCEAVKGLTPPAMSIGDATGNEGNSGMSALSFTVTLSAASAKPVSVAWATANGSATAPSDYQDTSGKVVFARGQTSRTVSVGVIGDTVYEPDETFTVVLSEPENATIADGSATGTITNDDPAFRAGHYAGATAQGKPIGFDVSSDVKTVVNVAFGYDLNCTEITGFTVTGTLKILVPVTINPDGTFALNDTYSEPGYREKFEFTGKLTAPSSASGSFKLAIEIDNIGGVATLHCQTGAQPVTWNAS